MARPRVHDDALRDRLIELAGREIAEHGPDALSLRGLAGIAGTSTSAVYTLFGGRPELLGVLFERASYELTRSQRSVPVTEDPETDLMGLGHNYRLWALRNPHWFAILFGGAADGKLPTDFDCTPRVNSIAPLAEAVHRLLAHLGSEVDPWTVVMSLWVVVHGFVMLELNGLISATAEELAGMFNTNTLATLRTWTSRAAG